MIKTDLEEFQRELPSQIIESMGRRGKYLLFLSDRQGLDFPFADGGQVFYYQTKDLNASMPMFSFILKMVARLFMRMFASLEPWNSWCLTF